MSFQLKTFRSSAKNHQLIGFCHGGNIAVEPRVNMKYLHLNKIQLFIIVIAVTFVDFATLHLFSVHHRHRRT